MSFGLIINHNLGSMSALAALNQNQNALQGMLKQLSTGKQINSAADNAAGYAISQKMQSQIEGLNQASQNSQDGISLIQTASGALDQTQSILQRMRQLSVQSSNDTNTVQDRQNLQSEVTQLTQQIDNISNTTQFNTKDLLNGGAGLQTTITQQVAGANINWLSVVGGSSATQLGTLGVTAATAATSATQTYTLAATAGAQNITINGHTLSYTATGTAATDAATLGSLINSNSSLLGASASVSSGALTITNSDVGSASKLTVGAAANALTVAAVTASSNGSDATLTSTGLPAGSYVATGNLINVTSGTYSGMQLQLNGGVMSSTAGSNTASIDVTGNGVMNFQIGANQGQTMSVSIQNMSSAALGVNNVNITSSSGAAAAISTIDTALQTVTAQQANLGAYQNRLQDSIANVDTSSQNLTTAQAGITDTNMASAMASFTKDNVLQQAAISMLAQANQQPQLVLKLLG